MHAYNETNLAIELYNSGINLTRDNPSAAVKMTTLAVADGKLFIATAYALSIFGNGLFLAASVVFGRVRNCRNCAGSYLE